MGTPEKKVGDHVVYYDKESNTFVARVLKIWSPPILNLIVKSTGEVVTSVCYKNYVKGATGNYWE